MVPSFIEMKRVKDETHADEWTLWPAGAASGMYYKQKLPIKTIPTIPIYLDQVDLWPCTMVNHHQTTIWENMFYYVLLASSILSKSKYIYDIKRSMGRRYIIPTFTIRWSTPHLGCHSPGLLRNSYKPLFDFICHCSWMASSSKSYKHQLDYNLKRTLDGSEILHSLG